MSNASANSSASREKKVNHKLTKLEIVGGCFVEEEEKLNIIKESILDFSDPVKDLAKSVGNFTIIKDADGNIVKRVDDENGVEYVKGKMGRYKTRKLRENNRTGR